MKFTPTDIAILSLIKAELDKIQHEFGVAELNPIAIEIDVFLKQHTNIKSLKNFAKLEYDVFINRCIRLPLLNLYDEEETKKYDRRVYQAIFKILIALAMEYPVNTVEEQVENSPPTKIIECPITLCKINPENTAPFISGLVCDKTSLLNYWNSEGKYEDLRTRRICRDREINYLRAEYIAQPNQLNTLIKQRHKHYGIIEGFTIFQLNFFASSLFFPEVPILIKPFIVILANLTGISLASAATIIFFGANILLAAITCVLLNTLSYAATKKTILSELQAAKESTQETNAFLDHIKQVKNTSEINNVNQQISATFTENLANLNTPTNNEEKQLVIDIRDPNPPASLPPPRAHCIKTLFSWHVFRAECLQPRYGCREEPGVRPHI